MRHLIAFAAVLSLSTPALAVQRAPADKSSKCILVASPNGNWHLVCL